MRPLISRFRYIKPVMIAIARADAMNNIAFRPKKPNRIIVIAKLAQGAARRKAIIAGVDAPFL